VFDGARLLPQACVVIEGGSIVDVSGHDVAPQPTGAIVTGGDLTLLPGLIDAHTHTWRDFVLADALRFGVTTCIDMMTPVELAARLRAEQRRQPVYERADLVSAGAAATAPGGHGTQLDPGVPTLSSPAEARQFVTARVKEGSDFIKIIYDSGVGTRTALPALSYETLRALVDAARECGRKAVVHALSRDAAMEAIGAGADGLAHAFIEGQADESFADEAARRGVFLIGTLTALEGALGLGGGRSLTTDPYLSPLLSPFWRSHLDRGRAGPELLSRYLIAQKVVDVLARRGVPVLAGTDTPNPGTAAGASLHRELELLVEAGLAPAAALEAATTAPAACFGLFDRGRIAPGCAADLLLVNGDPTKTITDSRRIAGVWRNGRRLSRGSDR
jgi:imidazolonepropionase-like amidohydrolase